MVALVVAFVVVFSTVAASIGLGQALLGVGGLLTVALGAGAACFSLKAAWLNYETAKINRQAALLQLNALQQDAESDGPAARRRGEIELLP